MTVDRDIIYEALRIVPEDERRDIIRAAGAVEELARNPVPFLLFLRAVGFAVILYAVLRLMLGCQEKGSHGAI